MLIFELKCSISRFRSLNWGNFVFQPVIRLKNGSLMPWPLARTSCPTGRQWTELTAFETWQSICLLMCEVKDPQQIIIQIHVPYELGHKSINVMDSSRGIVMLCETQFKQFPFIKERVYDHSLLHFASLSHSSVVWITLIVWYFLPALTFEIFSHAWTPSYAAMHFKQMTILTVHAIRLFTCMRCGSLERRVDANS
jgi:hypothetical protein